MASHVADDPAKPDTPEAKASDAGSTDMSQTQSDTGSKKSSTKRRKPAPAKSKPGKTARTTSIQADLDKLEARMKRANATTRKSVESLESVVSALEATLKSANASQKGRLTRHVNDLTGRLEEQSDAMRTAVRRELKAALAEGSLSDLDAALGRASLRLDRAEVAQADSLARINKHLADIARAVDARIRAEGRARREALDAKAAELSDTIDRTRADMEKRVATVERDSSAAMEKIGDTIEQLHGQMEDRRQVESNAANEKYDEFTAQTRAELDAYEAKLEERLKETETRSLAVSTGAAERVVERASDDIRRRIDALQARIEELEETDARTPDRSSVVPLPPIGTPANANRVGDTSPPSGTVAQAPVQSGMAPANPYAAALSAPAAAVQTVAAPVAEPVSMPEPPAFAAPPSPVVPFPGQAQPGAAEQPGTSPALPPFQLPSTQPPAHFASDAGAESDFQPAPMPDAVYSDPAYAESPDTRAGLMAKGGSDSPAALRIADDGNRRRFALPDLPPINPRVALMAGAAVIVAVFAVRIILGSSDGGNPDLAQTANSAPVSIAPSANPTYEPGGLTGDTLDLTAGPAPTAIEGDASVPVGTYEENQPVLIDMEKLDTLDAAVEAGNPIAQFQKGLAQLDAGETNAGAALIRQAADANQPAALYRLAKLYEAGEGVPRDDVMARQLIERAARGGNRIAMHDLALYYTEGRGGVDLDMATAKSWFEQAALRGVVDSQFNLAILNESAETGIEPDTTEALFWYSVAARQGDQFAIARRDALRGSMDAADLEQIDARLASFTPRPIDEQANGIFKDMPWVKAALNEPITDRDGIRRAQTLLAGLGYSIGTPDGVMGDRTRTAIRQFEQANGLSVSGEVDRELLGVLSTAADA